ncbi:hypothetical protein L1049_021890 [Liquidambar formosana]|uniref:Survival Motor Neuron Gemin2-binding domain-containing protein n=1 Tax=Liquidambar formosana TaxID=63359 RepID=A0AAP0RBL5_LIQFO
MGKEGELWDDSALITAFDDAMSKYKIMHGKGNRGSSTEVGKSKSSTGENVSAHVDEGHDAKRLLEADDNSNVASSTITEIGEVNNSSPVEENHGVDSCTPEPYIDSSNGLNMQDALKDYPDSQGVEDHAQLLSQYYELEEKRQQILWKLQQFDSLNYQCSGEGSGSGVQWGTCATSQEHQVPTNHASNPTVVCSCCPYLCPYMVAPCTSLPACSLGGTCVGKTSTDATAAMGPGKSCPLEDGNIVKTAIGAAEKAISSMKMKPSEKDEEQQEGKMAEGTSAETDLTDVLNAWYSAGFYTGKYLMEQSIAKKGHG